MTEQAPTEFTFPDDLEARGYAVFPQQLEDDDHIFFHGTAAIHLEPILNDGFAVPATLPSVSFAKQSPLALKYACEGRSQESPEGCILVVQFEPSQHPGLVVEHSVAHDYKCEPQPEIIGYCIVPADYAFI